MLPNPKLMLVLSWVLKSVGICMVLNYFFYKEVWGLLMMIPILIYELGYEIKRWKKQTLLNIERDFGVWLQYLKSEISAGYSITKAIEKIEVDYSKVVDKKSPIWLSLIYLKKTILLNEPIDITLEKIAAETQIKSIAEFTKSYKIAKQQGNSMKKILEQTISLIYRDYEMRAEIEATIRGKSIESDVMSVIPFGILLYVGTVSKGFFEVLYHNIFGVMVMSVCLIVYCFSVFLGKKIVLNI